MGRHKRRRMAAAVVLWILIWQAAAMLVHNRILFVGPAEVCLTLSRLVRTAEFWQSVMHSSVRIAGGFLLAFAAGLLLGAGAYRFSWLREFLEPAVLTLQSVPVASFVILALIWIGSKNLAVLICFLVVFPVIYRNTLQGMRAADVQLLEMAQVFRMSRLGKLRYLYGPAVLPYLKSASHVAMGMAWKSGVAAEVIGVPDLSIGEKLYMAKIYLSTAELFAWTLVVIVVSRLFEQAFLWLLARVDVTRGKGGNDAD